MRNYTGLIDSLMAYVQNCVAASRCDDKVRLWPRLQASSVQSCEAQGPSSASEHGTLDSRSCPLTHPDPARQVLAFWGSLRRGLGTGAQGVACGDGVWVQRAPTFPGGGSGGGLRRQTLSPPPAALWTQALPWSLCSSVRTLLGRRSSSPVSLVGRSEGSISS